MCNSIAMGRFKWSHCAPPNGGFLSTSFFVQRFLVFVDDVVSVTRAALQVLFTILNFAHHVLCVALPVLFALLNFAPGVLCRCVPPCVAVARSLLLPSAFLRSSEADCQAYIKLRLSAFLVFTSVLPHLMGSCAMGLLQEQCPGHSCAILRSFLSPRPAELAVVEICTNTSFLSSYKWLAQRSQKAKIDWNIGHIVYRKCPPLLLKIRNKYDSYASLLRYAACFLPSMLCHIALCMSRYWTRKPIGVSLAHCASSYRCKSQIPDVELKAFDRAVL